MCSLGSQKPGIRHKALQTHHKKYETQQDHQRSTAIYHRSSEYEETLRSSNPYQQEWTPSDFTVKRCQRCRATLTMDVVIHFRTTLPSMTTCRIQLSRNRYYKTVPNCTVKMTEHLFPQNEKLQIFPEVLSTLAHTSLLTLNFTSSQAVDFGDSSVC